MSTHPSKKIVKVMLFGTFDGLHPGHLNFFKQARRLGGEKVRLIASIARDENVFRIKKRYPRQNEKERVRILRNSRLLDKVILGGARNHLPHILRERPDIIALGYDQSEYVRNLKKDLQSRSLKVKIIRLKPYKKNIFKNSFLQGKNKTYFTS